MSDYTQTDIGAGYNSASSINSEFSKVAVAVNSKLDVTGDTMTGALDMNSQRIINLPTPTSAKEPVTLDMLSTLVASPTATVFFVDTVGAMVATSGIEVGDVVVTKEFATDNGIDGGGNYDVVLTSSVTPNTRNIIIGVDDATISFVLNIGSSANVDQFGAVGDGVTDDTLSIQATVDYFKSGGGTIRVSAKTYSLSSLSLDSNLYNGINIQGYSKFFSKLIFTTTATAIQIGAVAPAGVTSNIKLEDLFINSPNSQTMIEVNNSANCYFLRLVHESCGSTGGSSKGYGLFTNSNIHLFGVIYGGNVNARYGVYIAGDSCNTNIHQCNIKGEPTASDYSIVCNGDSGTPASIKDSVIGGGSIASILVSRVGDFNGVEITGCYFETFNIGVYLGQATFTEALNISIENNYFFEAGVTAINLQGCDDVNIINNYFWNGAADITLHNTVTINRNITIEKNRYSVATPVIMNANQDNIKWTDADGIVHDRLSSSGVIGGTSWAATSGAIADGNHLELDVTVTDAALKDFVMVSLNLDTKGVSLSATVTAADTVTCVLNNNTGGNITIGSSIVYVRVFAN